VSSAMSANVLPAERMKEMWRLQCQQRAGYTKTSLAPKRNLVLEGDHYHGFMIGLTSQSSLHAEGAGRDTIKRQYIPISYINITSLDLFS
jgi:hypothetical protein